MRIANGYSALSMLFCLVGQLYASPKNFGPKIINGVEVKGSFDCKHNGEEGNYYLIANIVLPAATLTLKDFGKTKRMDYPVRNETINRDDFYISRGYSFDMDYQTHYITFDIESGKRGQDNLVVTVKSQKEKINEYVYGGPGGTYDTSWNDTWGLPQEFTFESLCKP